MAAPPVPPLVVPALLVPPLPLWFVPPLPAVAEPAVLVVPPALLPPALLPAVPEPALEPPMSRGEPVSGSVPPSLQPRPSAHTRVTKPARGANAKGMQ